MRRRIAAVITSAALALGALVALVPAEAEAAFRVGAAKTDITWRFGEPIAPNPNVFSGLHSRAYAKAIVIDSPEGMFAMVRTDMLLITGDMHEAVAQRVEDLGIPAERLMLSSTHTHVTNNGMFPHPAHGVFYKSFDPREYAMIADRVADAVARAAAALRPATMAVDAGSVTQPAVNRRYTDRESLGSHPFGNDPSRLDPELGVIRFDDAATGEPIAILMNYGLHPVVLINKGVISADFVVWAERTVEAAFSGEGDEEAGGDGPMAVWFTGAEGDQDPIFVRYSYPEAEWTGRVFADEAIRVASAMEPEPIERAAIVNKIVPVPPPGQPTPSWQPAGPRTPVVGPASLLIPSSIRLQAIELSTASTSSVLMTWPGEPIRDLGVGLKDAASGLGFDRAFVIGLANDWSGYYVTPEEYDRGRYEASTFNFYGRESGTYVQHHLADLARSLATGDPPEQVPMTPQAILDRQLIGIIAAGGHAASGPLASATAAVPDADPAIEVQPSDITRPGQTTIEWIGGSPDVARGWIPHVQVQRRTADGWHTAAREGTGVVLLGHQELEPGLHRWRATWEALPDTPAGTYRILIDGRRQTQSLADEEFALVSDTFTVSACACLQTGEPLFAYDLGTGRLTVLNEATYPSIADPLRLQPTRVADGHATIEVIRDGTAVATLIAPYVSVIEQRARAITVHDVSGADLPVTIVEPVDVGTFETTWLGEPGDSFRLVSVTDGAGNTT